MSGWLLAIVGVIAIGVLLDIIIPEGETNKYIKGIFGIVVVLVIVSPLPKLFNSDFNFDEIFQGGKGYEIDETFTGEVAKERNEERQNKIKDLLIANNILVKRVKIGIKNNDFDKVEYVKIFYDKSIINNDEQHINIVSKCKDIVIKNIKVDISEVSVYAE